MQQAALDTYLQVRVLRISEKVTSGCAVKLPVISGRHNGIPTSPELGIGVYIRPRGFLKDLEALSCMPM
jgi:hypothetical protein